MPDAAIKRTENQFSTLLQAAAACLPLSIEYYSLPEIPRTDDMQQRLAGSYRPLCELWNNRPDAIIITGTEPRQRYLADEVYWPSFAKLIDWIDRTGIPAFYSCLAAHAAVWRLEGVDRVPLHRKCFGIFDHEVAAKHSLMDGAGLHMVLPHTRWNDVPERALARAGYEVLSWSLDAGVGFFSRRGTNVQLFCQGHPEYDSGNLMREYRRDVSRFLTGEQSIYPNLPQSYFEESEAWQLNAFKQRALAQPGEVGMDAFPTLGKERDGSSWGTPAVRIFNNWLRHAAMIAEPRQIADLTQSWTGKTG